MRFAVGCVDVLWNTKGVQERMGNSRQAKMPADKCG